MEWVETTGQSIEDAQAKALDLLNVDSADAEIEVLEDVKKGLFGRVKSDARVRARIKPKAPAPKDDRRNRRGGGKGGDRNRNRGKGGNNRGGRGGKGGNRDGGNRDGGNRDGGNRDGGNNRNKGGNRDGGGNRNKAKAGAAAAGAGAAVAAGRGSEKADNASKNDNNRANDNAKDDNNASNKPNDSNRANEGGNNRNDRGGKGRNNNNRNRDRNRQEPTVDEEFSVSEQQLIMNAFVGGVAKVFDAASTTEVVDLGEDTLEAQVSGDNLGLLVGPSGATLAALEELTRTALQRSAGGRRYHRIHVDVDEYKHRRREALSGFAVNVAQQVVDGGEPKALEAMNAADRKVVHDALTDVDGVTTSSEGDDPRRYVVISPA